jgi:hypothetical protein
MDDVEFEEDSAGEVVDHCPKENCDLEFGMELSNSLSDSRVSLVLDPAEVQELVDEQLEELLERR